MKDGDKDPDLVRDQINIFRVDRFSSGFVRPFGNFRVLHLLKSVKIHLISLSECECLQLRLGPAEQQFLAMTGGDSDSLQLVTNILSQLDSDNARST